MIASESGIEFSFPDEFQVLKFDDTGFYRRQFNGLPDSKAVDFLCASEKAYLMIEVKNCKGHEAENRWRLGINNEKLGTAPPQIDGSARESLDIEVAQKTAMTIAALAGAFSNPRPESAAAECMPLAEALFSTEIREKRRKLFVILLLEGEFGTGLQTRTNAMIHQRLKQSMDKKLKWLNCTVCVLDSRALQAAGLPFTANLT